MGARTEAASKGDAATIIARVAWLSEQAGRLSSDINLLPGPSFAFYQDRWNSDALVQIMSMAERGMHFTLMTYAWQQTPFCSLPDDEVVLRAWCMLHAEPQRWEEHRRVLFSGKDGNPRRAWVYGDGRWYQVGLCRTLLEQVARRLRRQKAGHARQVASSKASQDRAFKDHHRAMQDQCTLILTALETLPIPSPFPVPSPSAPNGAPRGGEADGDQVQEAWEALLAARLAACERIGQEPGRIALTEKRKAHLGRLLDDYGFEYLRTAFAAVVRSEYHLGQGRHRESGARLSFEAFTSTDGRVNQVEILRQLAEDQDAGKRRQPEERPFAPGQDPEGTQDDGTTID